MLLKFGNSINVMVLFISIITYMHSYNMLKHKGAIMSKLKTKPIILKIKLTKSLELTVLLKEFKFSIPLNLQLFNN